MNNTKLILLIGLAFTLFWIFIIWTLNLGAFK